MNEKYQLQVTRILSLLGITIAVIWGLFACDFEPSKIERVIGGSLAEANTSVNEFIEGGNSQGELSTNLLYSGDISLSPLSKHEIREMLESTDPKHLPSDPTQWYTELPNYTAPYKAGKIKQEYLELTLARLNALRRISGLHPVAMTDEYNDLAQHGAALMVITQGFGHGDQPRPKDMNEAFHKKGTDGTGRGNVYQQYPLIQSIDGYNLDPGNPGVGHRLWQLNPGLQAVGIGSAIKKKDADGKEIGYGGNVEVVTYTQAPEGAVTSIGDWNFISWPSAGYFPLEGNLFGNPSFWHVQFNGAKYTVGSGKIIVTRLDSGEQWIEEHGGGNTLVFNKSNTWRADLGRYTYEVTGVKDKTTDIPVRFVFTTEFFDRHSL